MPSKKKTLDTNQVLLIVVVAFLGLIFLILIWFAFNMARTSSQTDGLGGVDVEGVLETSAKNNATLKIPGADPEVESLINKISKHILLPSGNVSVATVENADFLRKQNPYVFQYTKNEDKLLIHAGGIITYDSVQDKIVDIIRIPMDMQPPGETSDTQ